jgi:hypothetical protein
MRCYLQYMGKEHGYEQSISGGLFNFPSFDFSEDVRLDGELILQGLYVEKPIQNHNIPVK